MWLLYHCSTPSQWSRYHQHHQINLVLSTRWVWIQACKAHMPQLHRQINDYVMRQNTAHTMRPKINNTLPQKCHLHHRKVHIVLWRQACHPPAVLVVLKAHRCTYHPLCPAPRNTYLRLCQSRSIQCLTLQAHPLSVNLLLDSLVVTGARPQHHSNIEQALFKEFCHVLFHVMLFFVVVQKYFKWKFFFIFLASGDSVYQHSPAQSHYMTSKSTEMSASNMGLTFPMQNQQQMQSYNATPSWNSKIVSPQGASLPSPHSGAGILGKPPPRPIMPVMASQRFTVAQPYQVKLCYCIITHCLRIKNKCLFL